MSTKYLVTARAWLWENTNDGDPEFDRRAESLAELLATSRNELIESCALAAEHVPVADRNPALVRNEIVDKIRNLKVAAA